MGEKPTLEGLRLRIQDELDHFSGEMPERVAICWDGYLAALLEWGLISAADHACLIGMLPKVSDNPVMAIFLGRNP